MHNLKINLKVQTLKNNDIVLKKGCYLAPSYQTHDFNDFLIGITEYEKPIETGVWHSHINPMISFVLYGSNIEYRKEKVIERTTGSINYYHSHELHKNTYNYFPSKHISIELSPNFLKQCGYTETQIEFAINKNLDSNFTFIKLMGEAQIKDKQSRHAIEMLFLAFIENALKSKDDTQFPFWMKSVRNLLNDRWNENISLKELSDKVDVHPTTISKNFMKYFQCTLGEYTRKLKINHSIDIMNSSRHSLTEIAYKCGFSDQSHFTRVFKSMTGYLPKEYAKI